MAGVVGKDQVKEARLLCIGNILGRYFVSSLQNAYNLWPMSCSAFRKLRLWAIVIALSNKAIYMHESIAKSSFRVFFRILSTILGLVTAFILVMLLINSIDTTDGEAEITYHYTPQVLPDASNVRKLQASTAPVVLVVNIHGEIGTELLNRQTIENLLIESRERSLKNDRVKGIILHMNTPGGTVTDSSGIYELLKAYKQQYKVPIYAYVDGLCASGGIYISCAADKIYTSNASIIGSVGVLLGPFMNYFQLMEKVGVQAKTLTAGKDKDEMNPLRPWKEDESAYLQLLTNYFYEHFMDVVSTNRPLLTKEKLRNEYGARIYDATAAEEAGFTDGSNYTFNQALTLLTKEIGIDDDIYQVIELENNNWLSSLLKNKPHLGFLTGEMKHSLNLPPQLNPEFMNQPLYLYMPN